MTSELRLVDIKGRQVWVEVDTALEAAPKERDGGTFENTSAAETKATSRGAVAAAVAGADIEGTLESVVSSVEAALKSIKPQELSVELKLGFKADAGVFIARTSGEASITIKAVWKPT